MRGIVQLRLSGGARPRGRRVGRRPRRARARGRKPEPRAREGEGGRIIVPGANKGVVSDPNLATLQVSANERAWVYVNGRRLGPTKLIRRVRAGKYTVYVRKGKRTSRAKVVKVGAGQSRHVHFELD